MQTPLTNTDGAEASRSSICARCQQPNVSITVRNEYLCQDCFKKYIVNKVNKKLESNKLRAGFKDAPNQLLLPISFGCSSISLLHVLDKQLHQQEEKTGRFSFQIHVLYIDQSAAGLQVDSDGTWRALKERFPSHSYSIARIEDVCDDDTDFASDGFLPTSSTANGPNFSKQQRLEDFLAGLPSATSRADMISILRSRLIASFAKKQDCSSILYGDSTTRLAERTLSETAKGRGAAIPWLTADGESPHGVKVVYPIRDLLRKEIVAYTTMTDPPLTPLILEDRVRDVVTSSKNTTIEALMGQYFESVEQNYPSIVANVVRTSSKLVAPPTETGTGRVCQICKLPLAEGSEGLRWSGEQERSDRPTHRDDGEDAAERCYGCARSMLKTS